MNRVTITADNLGYELAKTEMDLLAKETEYEIFTAKLYLSTSAKNKKYAVVADETVEKLRNELNIATARVKLLTAIVNGCDRQYKALSRDQTRRQLFFEKRRSI